MRDDQMMLGIHSYLHIIERESESVSEIC